MDEMPGVFLIEIESQRTRNHVVLLEAIRQAGVTTGVIADGFDPFSYDPQTISPVGDFGDVKIRERSEPLEGWMKC